MFSVSKPAREQLGVERLETVKQDKLFGGEEESYQNKKTSNRMPPEAMAVN